MEKDNKLQYTKFVFLMSWVQNLVLPPPNGTGMMNPYKLNKKIDANMENMLLYLDSAAKEWVEFNNRTIGGHRVDSSDIESVEDDLMKIMDILDAVLATNETNYIKILNYINKLNP